jgi:hypothetical protein
LKAKRPPQIVISCHADTGFRSHRLKYNSDLSVTGQLDNFVGVHCVMQAYFSGRLDFPNVRIELTYGEEVDMAGAYEVLETLSPDDTVIVVDVTGTPTDKDIVIEKCMAPIMREFINKALQGMSYDMYADCPDPIANCDESDVYRERLENVFFLGIPCTGGDYNDGPVTCRKASIDTTAEAIIRLAAAFQG